ncbi:MAG: fatty acid desaturase family protein [Planctomycetota bacterium]|jgi:fatty acid desaturase
MAGGNWHAQTSSLRREFRELIDPARLRRLHRVSGSMHAWIALRQFALAALTAFLIVRYRDRWPIWVPSALLLGFVIFSFTVLLHEVVHRAVFLRREGRLNALLGWIYALPSGLSPSQFTRWHLDHHAELGTGDKDPKRHHLTPRIVRRWYKALYLTPALFPLYFRAAGREAASYPPEFRRRLRRERAIVIGAHLLAVAAIAWIWGGAVFVKLYLIPVFFVFPVAFTINRLGQHYDIEPEDPAAWGTIIRTNLAWNFLFLWSSYHMEHHYFPAVPFYNLPALHRELRPILERHPVRVRTYGGLLFDWFVRNKSPHVSWN